MHARAASRWMVGSVAVAIALAVGFAIAWGATTDTERGVLLLAGAIADAVVMVAGYWWVRRLHWS
jgi:putative flippase GtrA